MARKKELETSPEAAAASRETKGSDRNGPDLGAMTYETALALLEATVSKLENGSMPLEESLGAFDEGIGLVRLLTGRLDAMEQRMLVLLEGKDGREAVPFE